MLLRVFSGFAEVENFDDLWILHHWICLNTDCMMDNAMLIHIRDGRIVEFESGLLNGDSLRRAHFMDSEIGNTVLERVHRRVFPDADEREVLAGSWDDLFYELCLGRDSDDDDDLDSNDG